MQYIIIHQNLIKMYCHPLLIIFINSCLIFSNKVKTLIINPQYIEGLLSKGIIAEKKSANEELAERICSKYWESGDCRVQRLYTVILEELEKAGVK